METLRYNPPVKVVSALHKIDQCLYAVKKYCHPISNFNPELLMNEAQIMINLDHPNIVRYSTSWIEFSITCKRDRAIEFDTKALTTTSNVDFIFYIQMDYAKTSWNFADLRNWTLPARVNRFVALQSPKKFHSAGIVFNALKPSNIHSLASVCFLMKKAAAAFTRLLLNSCLNRVRKWTFTR